jgi:hypothetical protein
MLPPLLLGTVIPALPASVCILMANMFVEAEVSNGKNSGMQEIGSLVLLALALPLAVWGSRVIARSWARAVLAAASPGPGPEEPRPAPAVAGRVWAVYLAGLACLMAIAAAAPHLISDAQVAGGITDGTAPGFVLSFAGPVGLLGPVILLTPAPWSAEPRPGTPARLAAAAAASVCYGLAVGYLTYRLIAAFPGTGLVLPVAAVADLLAIPSVIFLACAGLAVTPGPRTPG